MRPSLTDIRYRLNRRLETNDGWVYRGFFGCSSKETLSIPHVVVRVELRAAIKHPEFYQFVIFVDFHSGLGVDIGAAEQFKQATDKALRKARWARNLVEGIMWHRTELT